jgi:hypothetical protein
MEMEGGAYFIDEHESFGIKLTDLSLIRLTLLLNRLTVPFGVI